MSIDKYRKFERVSMRQNTWYRKYRIVGFRTIYKDWRYYVECWRIWLPFWLECFPRRGSSVFDSIHEAEIFVSIHSKIGLKGVLRLKPENRVFRK